MNNGYCVVCGEYKHGLSWCPICREMELRKIDSMSWEQFWKYMGVVDEMS